jgi:uncharacterized repeat protein (TIGR01451 family)
MRARSRSFYATRLRLIGFTLLCVWLFISGGVVLAQNSTTGNIFRDFDADGVRDVNEPGIGGVLVTGYDAAGNVYGPVTADIAFATRGNYSLTTPASVTDLRLEYTYPSLTFLRDGAVGANSATSVRFVTAGATGADFAVSDPAQYCDANPLLATSCYRFGDQLTGDNASSPSVVDFNYDGSGGVNTRAVASEVGAVWGLAHQRSSDDLFAGSFVKRHVGLGPSGDPGTIYRIDRTTSTVTQYITLSAGLASDAHSPDDDNPPGEPRYFSDIRAVNAVGRVGLGDMELSGDESVLYVVNLSGTTGSLVTINIGSPAVAVPTVAGSIAFPTPPSCTAANTRPGALEWYDGLLYVGLTCTGPTVSDLRAYVYTFNGSSFSAAPVVNIPLNYDRGCVSDNGSVCAPAEWQPWITYTSGDVNLVFDRYDPYDQYYKPQPWLLDMEIDAYGFMALNFADRAGHQLGNNRGLAESGPVEGVAAGDLLRLAPDVNLTSWSIESNGTVGSGIPGGGTGGTGNGQGPGNGEFYSADNFGGTHDEITVGGTALIPSQNEIVASAMDPTSNILSGGVIYLDNSDGSRNGARQLFGTNQPGTFGKAAGIGDIEALCLAAPIQVGNRLWVDSNRNGLQDPGEAPLPGVRVELRTAVGGLITFATTAADGTYYFSSGPGTTSTSAIYGIAGLTPNTGYQVVIPTTHPTNVTSLAGYTITTANVPASPTAPNASDVNDSDFTPTGSDLIVPFTTGSAGANDHSFDGGFFASDRGDLPDTTAGIGANDYQTLLANGGPTHPIVTGLRLGAIVDAEGDGQPGALANGDDTVGTPDDEDGVTVADLTLIGGAAANIRVTATNTLAGGVVARIFGFIDFNGDGDFLDANETATVIVPNGSAGVEFTLAFGTVPLTSVAATYARFRLSTDAALTANGVAANGEVEDYPVTVTINRDYGDLPDSGPGVGTTNYETTLASGGASHVIVPNLFMGAVVDSETNGVPSGGADGDDLALTPDDEDGVDVADLTLAAGSPANVDVNVTNNTGSAATLYGFIDFNGDGDFLDAGETTTQPVPNGTTGGTVTLAFGNVPVGSAAATYARFRLSNEGGLTANGASTSGEVEDYPVTITPPTDRGDLPDPQPGVAANDYETLIANGGPSHPIIAGLRMGATVDGELDGQPNAAANGDDIALSPDDEDGITVADLTLTIGAPADIRVNVTNTTGADATLYGFIDFNGDGDFGDTNETVTLVIPNNPAAQNVTLAFGTVPAGSVTSSYARFRLSSDTGLGANGAATDGEVEDYPVTIAAFDRGDLPDSGAGVGVGNYETLLASNGASHAIVPNLFMGATVDSEPNGQPIATADGDDTVGTPDDEDGVDVADLTLTAGAPANIDVSVTNNTGSAATLYGFIDFNGDGDFLDTGESTTLAVPSSPTAQALTLNFAAVPNGSVSATYARFRLSNQVGLNANGNSTSGEVEDYPVVINAFDRGDLPDPQAGIAANDYETLLANGGPTHPIVAGLRMGATVDSEPDGQPNAAANGDDIALSPDDEDGVTVADLTLTAGSPANVRVNATNTTGTPATIFGFIDFNGDGDFGDANETATIAVPTGSNNVQFTLAFGTVPSSGSAPATYARFRLSTDGSLGANGAATNGEVEDYPVTIAAFDRGDLPDTTAGVGAGNYQTLLANGGASHAIVPGLLMGTTVDSEPNGQPNTTADGDDTTGTPDDEDGVTVADLTLTVGSPANVRVTATNTTGAAATLYGFIDFNGDGDFTDTGETATIAVPTGSTGVEFTLVFGNVPTGSVANTYARFRLSNQAGLTANGSSTSGEVEDYLVVIDVTTDRGDLPDSGPGVGVGNYETTIASGGASHTIITGLRMGAAVDDDADGQPNVGADGDDTAGTPDDEDGVTVADLTLAAGAPANVRVNVTNTTGAPATLYGFIDFNGDGDFLDTNEAITIPVANGTNNAVVTLPFGTVPTTSVAATYARFRLSNQAGLTANGASTSGEVEDYPVTITPQSDRGDLPDTAAGVGAGNYETLVANGGPSHPIVAGLRMGATVDGEPNGQPNAAATGDDAAGAPDDEDGVTIADLTLTQGAPANIRVTATNTTGTDATLFGFIDFNGDGDFDDTDETATIAVPTGSANTVFTLDFGFVPAGSATSTYARFRLSTDGTLTANGAATDGEVEDYRVTINIPATDRGDLPDTAVGVSAGNYETLTANGGPSHPIITGLRLGATVDGETDGQPTGGANGDDAAGDDEDGVTVADLTLTVGNPANVRVRATNTVAGLGAVTITGFIDFNGDGDFDDAGETTSVSVPNGSNNVEFTLAFGTVPAGSAPTTYARFRITSDGVVPATGAASNGEVEDYFVSINAPVDRGDLPDTALGVGAGNYETLDANGGPSHPIIPGLRIGANLDGEPNGQPNTGASGDDAAGTPDDEDGVTVADLTLTPGNPANVRVNVTNTNGTDATLYGFIDFNGDGDFADAGESVTLIIPSNPTPQNVTLVFGTVPAGSATSTYARFRLSTDTGLTANGAATNGEVEDYPVSIGATGVDRGDLPDTAPGIGAGNYETLGPNNGPTHPIIPTLRMGSAIDGETNGQPNAAANGDDGNGAPDDEDGVNVADLTLTQGAVPNVRVTVTNTSGADATVFGFIDFNGDGDFDDAGETATAIAPNGITSTEVTLTFGAVPAGSVTSTYARFRLSTDTTLTANGPAINGEVEDYPVIIGAGGVDRGDLPDTAAGVGAGNYETLDANGAPSHPIVPGLRIGAAVDGETDGQPNAAASGDDGAGTPDDEDGVTVADLTLTEGAAANVRVRATNTTGTDATLYGFIDFNGDGDFDDAGEATTVTVPNNSSNVEFTLLFGTVPAGSAPSTYARFRLSTDGGLTANGAATDGEVEDYPVTISVGTLSLGNRVWEDTDNSGTLNGGEAGIDNVTVDLYRDTNADGVPDGAPIFSTTTTGGGYYLFDNLPPGTYIVGIPAAEFSGGDLVGFRSSTGPGQEPSPESSGDSNDNGLDAPDPAASGILSAPVILSAGGEPINETDNGGGGSGSATNPDSNLTLDFGFFQPPPGTLSLGNRVWIDTDNDGTLNGSEVGRSGVRLTLYDAAAPTVPIATTTTDGSGYYLFVGLQPGSYIVGVDASNFATGGRLQGSLSSTGAGQEADPESEGDSNDNGIDNPTPTSGGVRSGTVILSLGGEPTGEGDTGSGDGGVGNDNSNLTVDFGFSTPTVTPPTPTPPPNQPPSGTPQPSIFDPGISKAGDPAFAQPGEIVVWTITVTNPNNVPLNNVGFTDDVPNTLEVLGATASAGSVTTAGQIVTFNITTLPANAIVTIQVTTRVRSNVVPPFVITNTATLNGGYSGSASATVSSGLEGISELPATGESPWWRAPLLLALVVLAAWIGRLAWVQARRE